MHNFTIVIGIELFFGLVSVSGDLHSHDTDDDDVITMLQFGSSVQTTAVYVVQFINILLENEQE